jgi:GNAT superfamily N-acetyltransferase
MPQEVRLQLLKEMTDAGLDRALSGIAALGLLPEQLDYVGQPLSMAAASLADPTREPFTVVNDGAIVGMGTLQLDAARLAGWKDNSSAVLLRGFLIGVEHQGQGYGRLAAAACVPLAARLAAAAARPGRTAARGVVLSVNERNSYGISAYSKAGFVDRGRFQGGSAGPQRIMYRPFPTAAD